MERAVTTRVASGMLVLLACAVALHRNSDRTPTRTVTEIVSVVHVPARALPTQQGPAVPAPEVAIVQEPPGQEFIDPPQVAVASLARPSPRNDDDVRRAALVPAHASLKAPSAEQPEHVVARAASRRASPEPQGAGRAQLAQRHVRVASPCRSAACQRPAGSRVARHRAAPEAGTQQASLPRVLHPVRSFGLFLQAKLLTPEERRAAGSSGG